MLVLIKFSLDAPGMVSEESDMGAEVEVDPLLVVDANKEVGASFVVIVRDASKGFAFVVAGDKLNLLVVVTIGFDVASIVLVAEVEEDSLMVEI